MQDAGRFEEFELPGRCWRHGEKTFSQTFHGLQHRVEQCMNESPAFQQCNAEAELLYQAMSADIEDSKRSYAGEKHRILVRAKALRKGLEDQDPSIRHVPWESPLVEPSHAPVQVPAVAYAEATETSCPLEGDDVTAYSALQSACLLLAALFEQTPFSDTDVRRRVFADYTVLKKDFRHCSMQTLHGPTTSIGELFGSIKDLDKAGMADNVQGIVFDDWMVHARVDAFLNADLDVEATCLTQEGPVGKISCKLRTFVVLALLQERLLKQLFATKFVGQAARGYEEMSMDDPLDFYDFVEAMVRNTPSAYSAAKGMYYAWLYAPEVNATPEHWESIFGLGENRLPSLYGSISTPDDSIVADPKSDSGYSMDLEHALNHDFKDTWSQAAVGFPWADDLLGRFLRKLREKRQQQEQQAIKQQRQLELKQQQLQDEQTPMPTKLAIGKVSSPCKAESSPVAANGTGGSAEEESVGALANNEGMLVMCSSCSCKQEEGLLLQGTHCECKLRQCEATSPAQQGGVGQQQRDAAEQPCSKAEVAMDMADLVKRRRRKKKCVESPEAQPKKVKLQVKEEPREGEAEPGPGSVAGEAAWQRRQRQRQHQKKQHGLPQPPQDKLPLPLGIFFVGIITSSCYTNTQLHIEDLMLMSINVNIFGAPKIWWWIPQATVPAFKAFAETLSPGGRDDLYTKAVAPFIMDKSLTPPEHRMPLSKLKEFGARRVIQMPGMAILTSPGYAFHFTVSMGLNIAESCNMFLEMLGWDVERIWKERPLEQYPDPENSMAKWMYDSGVLATLGLDAGPLHLERVPHMYEA